LIGEVINKDEFLNVLKRLRLRVELVGRENNYGMTGEVSNQIGIGCSRKMSR
jgi:hypothetical protein